MGRAYVGCFGFDLMSGASIETANLVRVDPDGSVRVVASDLWFPNGSVITEQGVLLVDETFGNRVSAFDIAADGSLGPRRDWARFGDLPTSRAIAEALPQAVVCPDGCGLDADGMLWIADAVNGRVIRVREGGEIVEEIVPGTGCVRLHARRYGRPHALHLRGAGLRGRGAQGGAGGEPARGAGRRAARRASLIAAVPRVVRTAARGRTSPAGR